MSEPDPNALAALIAEVKDTNERLRQASDGLDTAGDPGSSQWMADFRVDEDIIAAAEAALIQSHLPQGEDTALAEYMKNLRRKDLAGLLSLDGDDSATDGADMLRFHLLGIAASMAARAPQRDEGNGER